MMKRIFEKLQEIKNALVKRKEVKGYCSFCGKPLKEKLFIYKFDDQTGEPELFKFNLDCENKIDEQYFYHDHYFFIADKSLTIVNLTLKNYKYSRDLFKTKQASRDVYLTLVDGNYISFPK